MRSGVHRLKGVAEHKKGTVETLLAAAIELVIPLTSAGTNRQLVELLVIGGEGNPAVHCWSSVHEAFALGVEQA